MELAIQAKADALLIAGDLFDHRRIAFSTERFLLQQLARLKEAGIAVCYACGNHDPGSPNSPVHRLPWPDNVAVFSRREPQSHLIRDREGQPLAVVTGAGHGSPAEGENLAESFPRAALPGVAPGSVPHVGLLHAWVQGSAGDEHDRYAPCRPDDLVAAAKAAHIDYWALGHIHLRQELNIRPRAFYPGNPQGRSFRETGPKGALLVDIHPDRTVDVQFVPLAPVRWEILEISDLDQFHSSAHLQRHLEEACRHIQAGDDPSTQWLFRLELKGACPLAAELQEDENRSDLEQQLQEALGALHVEIKTAGLAMPVDVDAYRDGPHVLATALQLLAQAETDDQLLDRLTPNELAGIGRADPRQRRAYLRQLLRELPLEAASRLVIRDGGAIPSAGHRPSRDRDPEAPLPAQPTLFSLMDGPAGGEGAGREGGAGR